MEHDGQRGPVIVPTSNLNANPKSDRTGIPARINGSMLRGFMPLTASGRAITCAAIPTASSACSFSRSKFVVTMTLTDPRLTSSAIARCPLLGVLIPCSRSSVDGSKKSANRPCRAVGVGASASRRDE